MFSQSDNLKEQGNTAFRCSDFVLAEAKYTAAITLCPSNPLLYTNRALARLKLQRWESAVDDCLTSIDITNTSARDNGKGISDNYKAWYYLAQAQLALHRPREAVASALCAYEQVLRSPEGVVTGNGGNWKKKTVAANVGTISAFVVECKRAKFAAGERERARKRGEVLGEVEEALEVRKRGELSDLEEKLIRDEIGVVEADEARREVLEQARRRVEEVRLVFAVADPEQRPVREVPDFLVDTITFEIMVSLHLTVIG